MNFNITLSNTSTDFSNRSNSLLVKIFSDKKNLKRELDDFLGSRKIILNSSVKKIFLSKEKQEIKFINHVAKPDQVILTKVFADEKFDVDKFRDLMSKLIISLKDDDVNYMQVELPSYDLFKEYYSNSEYFYQTIVEGIHLGNYTFDTYKSDKKSPKRLKINFNIPTIDVKSSIKKGENILSSVDFA